MTDKDLKEYELTLAKLKKDTKFNRLQQEQRDLQESYEQSKRNKDEHLNSFSEDLKKVIKKKVKDKQ